MPNERVYPPAPTGVMYVLKQENATHRENGIEPGQVPALWKKYKDEIGPVPHPRDLYRAFDFLSETTYETVEETGSVTKPNDRRRRNLYINTEPPKYEQRLANIMKEPLDKELKSLQDRAMRVCIDSNPQDTSGRTDYTHQETREINEILHRYRELRTKRPDDFHRLVREANTTEILNAWANCHVDSMKIIERLKDSLTKYCKTHNLPIHQR